MIMHNIPRAENYRGVKQCEYYDPVAGCCRKSEVPKDMIPLSVIEDIKAEIEELGIWHEKLLIETIDIKRVLEIIDKAVKECTHEPT